MFSVVCFLAGFVFASCGVILFLIEYRLCGRIEKETRGEPNALTAGETWLNTQQFRKWRKLRSIAASHENVDLRLIASKALRFEMLGYASIVSGIVFVVFGALSAGSAL